MDTTELEKEKALNTQQTPQEPVTTEPSVNIGPSQMENPLANTKGVQSINPEGYKGPGQYGTPATDTDVSEGTEEGNSAQGNEKFKGYGMTYPNTVTPRTTTEEANQQGEFAKDTMLNAEIPKWERLTIGDIIRNPEYRPIADSLLANKIGAVGSSFLLGKPVNSAIDQYNQEQAQRYSQARADRDTRALDTQLQAIEAANARDVGEILSVADAQLGRELDRYGLLYDTETKKKVLDQMLEDSKEFLDMDPSSKMALTAYQQYLNGDATLLDSLFGTYGPKLVGIIEEFFSDPQGFVDKIKNGGSGGSSNPVVTSFGGKDYTKDEIVTRLNNGTLDSLISTLPVEEQRKVYNDITGSMKTSGWGKDVSQKTLNQLNTSITGREKQKGASDQAIKEADARAKEISDSINEIQSMGLNEKDYAKRIEDLQKDFNSNIKSGLVQTENVLSTKATLDNLVAKAKATLSIKDISTPLSKKIPKLTRNKNGFVENTDKNNENIRKALENLAGTNWDNLISSYSSGYSGDESYDYLNEGVMGTQGYKDVVAFLEDPYVQNYASKNANATKDYKTATNNLTNRFNGKYSFYQF